MEQRRSARRSVEIPIRISGKDSDGQAFEENTRTIVVSSHGALIATTHQLASGIELTVENPAAKRVAKASVVWCGQKRSPKDPFEVGVQLIEGHNIWDF